MLEKANKILFVSAFLVFGIVTFNANAHDWNQFYSKAEVEVRSWVVNGEVPLWSYQLCGGVSRLGDPESFGLSPLIIPMIMFGSVWGLKWLVLGLTLLNFLAMRGILLLLGEHHLADVPKKERASLASMVSLAFVLGNYFVWHVIVGHVTFPLCALVLALVYYFLRAAYGKTNWKDALAVFLISWTWLSGPFYHSFLFFFLPIGLICAFVTIVSFVKSTASRKPLLYFFVSAALGILPAAYKLWGIYDYQSRFPRTLSENRGTNEAISFGQVLLDLTMPTFKGTPLFLDTSHLRWHVHEYSVFSLVTFLFVFALVCLFLNKSSERVSRPRLLFGSLVAGAICSLLFSLGSFSTYAPFALINELLNQSARTPSRFQGSLVFFLALLSYALLLRSRTGRASTLGACRIGVTFLVLVNVASNFAYISRESFAYYSAMPNFPIPKMNMVAKAEDATVSHWTLNPIRRGAAVLNCYVPISRNVVKVIDEKLDKPVNFLLAPKGREAEFSDCRNNSWFTQNEIYLDESCTSGICLGFHDINIYRDNPFEFNERAGLFCLP